MTDRDTIKVYNEKAKDYADRFDCDEPHPWLLQFIRKLPENSHVLDWGCGPGTHSHHLREAGHMPEAIDASSEMVAFANNKYDINAKVGTFDDPLGGNYNGAWVNFSLLHAKRDAFMGHLSQLYEALVPNGILHLGLKRGEGEKRDKFGRYYTLYETSELTRYLEQCGFKILEITEGIEAGLAETPDQFVLILVQR